MEKLLQHHIEESRKNFDLVREDIHELKVHIDSLKEFKVQMIATSRFASLVVSAFCGLLSLIISTAISLKLK